MRPSTRPPPRGRSGTRVAVASDALTCNARRFSRDNSIRIQRHRQVARLSVLSLAAGIFPAAVYPRVFELDAGLPEPDPRTDRLGHLRQRGVGFLLEGQCHAGPDPLGVQVVAPLSQVPKRRPKGSGSPEAEACGTRPRGNSRARRSACRVAAFPAPRRPTGSRAAPRTSGCLLPEPHCLRPEGPGHDPNALHNRRASPHAPQGLSERKHRVSSPTYAATAVTTQPAEIELRIRGRSQCQTILPQCPTLSSVSRRAHFRRPSGDLPWPTRCPPPQGKRSVRAMWRSFLRLWSRTRGWASATGCRRRSIWRAVWALAGPPCARRCGNGKAWASSPATRAAAPASWPRCPPGRCTCH
jgi:hypothetical protein